jgi:RNA polymerase sigma factor (sigma-70 family)
MSCFLDYQKYCKTKKESFFEDFYNNISGLVKYRISNYGFRKEDTEDILQEVFLNLYLASKNYNKNGSLNGYINKIIFNTIITDIKQYNSNKNRIHQGITSLDNIEEDRKSLYDVLSANINLENMYITRETIEEYFKKICKGLSSTEQEIFKLNVITRDNQSKINEISKITGYTEKEINNALTRIRIKIIRIFVSSWRKYNNDFSIQNVANLLGVHTTTIGQWIDRGYLKCKYRGEFQESRSRITWRAIRQFMIENPDKWNAAKVNMKNKYDWIEEKEKEDKSKKRENLWWQSWEDSILKELYPDNPDKCYKILKRSKTAVKIRVCRLRKLGDM